MRQKDCHLGNGWHVTAASCIIEALLDQAVKGKQGKGGVQYLDMVKQGTHVCTNGCRMKVKLGDVRKLIKERQAQRHSNRANGDDAIIDV